MAVLALALAGVLPAPAAATTFRVKNDRGIAQYTFWKLDRDRSWRATDAFGRADIQVAPGDVVRFTRTFAGPSRYPPPEGYRGRKYTVPRPVPADVVITLRHSGPIYRPGLSSAERRVIRKLNEKRAQRGVPPLRVSKTLNAAADSMARRSVIEDRWPPSYLTIYQQDFGWPSAVGAALDSPGKSARKAVAHWTDGSVRERVLTRPSFNAIGVGEGGGWFIAQLGTCPSGPARVRCRLR